MSSYCWDQRRVSVRPNPMMSRFMVGGTQRPSALPSADQRQLLHPLTARLISITLHFLSGNSNFTTLFMGLCWRNGKLAFTDKWSCADSSVLKRHRPMSGFFSRTSFLDPNTSDTFCRLFAYLVRQHDGILVLCQPLQRKPPVINRASSAPIRRPYFYASLT